jgi:hypothetical protein
MDEGIFVLARFEVESDMPDADACLWGENNLIANSQLPLVNRGVRLEIGN